MSAALTGRGSLTPPADREESDLRVLESRSPASFAQEQIRGLVREVFCASPVRSVRQVIFSAVERETDVQPICRQIAETLALETLGSVAIVGGHPRLLQDETSPEQVLRSRRAPLREAATRLRANLWLIPRSQRIETFATAASLHAFLAGLRSEFDYSIVEAPPAGESYAAAAMGQFADGIILVLSARHTRRVTARRVKESLERAQTRLLGTVLSDRVFPIPEAIYQRL